MNGHGRMMDPPSRNAMWRLGFSNPINYNDNEVFCGGVGGIFEMLKLYTSSVLPELLHHFLAPTLCTCIYWVQADIMSTGTLGAQVDLPVTNLARRRKYRFLTQTM